MDKTQLTDSQKEQMISDFTKIIESYNVDWIKIVDTNQYDGNYTDYKLNDEEMRKYKLDKFCDAIAEIRKRSSFGHPGKPMSLRKFGEILSYSQTQIQNIEKHQIKNLPIDRLEEFAEKFSTSVAYLIGLTHVYEMIPNKIDCYFWENPKSEYRVIEDDIRDRLKDIEPRLSYMIMTEQERLEIIKNDILKLIGSNYNLAVSLHELLSKKGQKRYNIIKVLEYLKNI